MTKKSQLANAKDTFKAATLFDLKNYKCRLTSVCNYPNKSLLISVWASQALIDNVLFSFFTTYLLNLENFFESKLQLTCKP